MCRPSLGKRPGATGKASPWNWMGRAWCMSVAVVAVATTAPFTTFATPLFSFEGHGTEGFAMDWSPTVTGR